MKGQKIIYSPRELAFVQARSDWPRDRLHAEFCATFARPEITRSNIASLCKRHGWLTGRTGRFVPGQVPANKGKPFPTRGRSAQTQFHKGQRPHTFRGAGHERIDNKDGYVIMIVAETNPWTGAATRPVQKHRWLWEQANGPMPEGYVLKSLDGDKTNTDPANWRAIPRGMLPRLAGRWRLGYDEAPAELKPTIMATAELAHATREARKKRRTGE